MYIHTVSPGESSGGIERRFSLRRGALAEYNALMPGARLRPGMALGIPGTLRAREARRELWGFGEGLSRGELERLSQAVTFIVLPGLSIGEGLRLWDDKAGLAAARAGGALPMILAEGVSLRELSREGLAGDIAGAAAEAGYSGVLFHFEPRFDFEAAALEDLFARAAEALHGAGLLCAALDTGDVPLPGTAHTDRVLRPFPGRGERGEVLILRAVSEDRRQDGLRRELSLAGAWELFGALETKLRQDSGSFFDYADPEGLEHRVRVRGLGELARLMRGAEAHCCPLALSAPCGLSPAELELFTEHFEAVKLS